MTNRLGLKTKNKRLFPLIIHDLSTFSVSFGHHLVTETQTNTTTNRCCNPSEKGVTQVRTGTLIETGYPSSFTVQSSLNFSLTSDPEKKRTTRTLETGRVLIRVRSDDLLLSVY